MAEGLNCILNIVRACKLRHITESRNVNPITDSQTVQAKTGTDMLGHEKNDQLCLQNSTLLVVCQTLL